MRISSLQLRRIIREEVERSIDDVTVGGSTMTEDEIESSVLSTVKAYKPQIAFSWQQILKQDPEANGIIEAKWKITKGNVSDVKIIKNTTPTGVDSDVKGTLSAAHRADFADRVERAISKWKFQPLITDEVESYRWIFPGK